MFLKIRKQSDEKHYSSWLDNKYTFQKLWKEEEALLRYRNNEMCVPRPIIGPVIFLVFLGFQVLENTPPRLPRSFSPCTEEQHKTKIRSKTLTIQFWIQYVFLSSSFNLTRESQHDGLGKEEGAGNKTLKINMHSC